MNFFKRTPKVNPLAPLSNLAVNTAVEYVFSKSGTIALTDDKVDYGSIMASTREITLTLQGVNLVVTKYGKEAIAGLILHEMGHALAYGNGEDYTDEVLAWKHAEDIWSTLFTSPLPKGWVELRTWCLSTYGITDTW